MKNPFKKSTLSLNTKSDFSDIQFVAEMQRTIDDYERNFDELAAFAASPYNSCFTGTRCSKRDCAQKVYDFISFVAKNYPEAVRAWCSDTKKEE
ncbi:MAG: hypothetical protein IJ338_02325 [Bacteroidaceae bacterium]|nr:hypothetical protein [Bacteroidaceae bacterium]